MNQYFPKGLITIVLTACIAICTSTQATSQNNPEPAPKRILFIGNSYTNGIRGHLSQMLKNSPYEQSKFAFITKGGATLAKHIKDKKTLEIIKTGNWDYVVLQEQSQTPALGGKFKKSFHTSVDTLCKLIREAGAQPVLYMTWGRRDGDKRNKFRNFESMQTKLTRAYTSAAKRNSASLAPVGQAWSVVRKKDKALGNALFQNDGSHPSAKGAYLTSCVFFRVLFNDSLESLKRDHSLAQNEWQIIKNAALSVEIPDYKNHRSITRSNQ